MRREIPHPSSLRGDDFYYGPNRCRYSDETMNDRTISAFTKSPLNEFNLFSQNWYPLSLKSGASVGLRRRYP